MRANVTVLTNAYRRRGLDVRRTTPATVCPHRLWPRVLSKLQSRGSSISSPDADGARPLAAAHETRGSGAGVLKREFDRERARYAWRRAAGLAEAGDGGATSRGHNNVSKRQYFQNTPWFVPIFADKPLFGIAIRNRDPSIYKWSPTNLQIDPYICK
jgi:hypothetical protein